MGELEPNGHRAGFESGDPRRRSSSSTPRSRPGSGSASPAAGSRRREDTEGCYILSGRATITQGDTGTVYEVSAGDVIVQPKGWSGR